MKHAIRTKVLALLVLAGATAFTLLAGELPRPAGPTEVDDARRKDRFARTVPRKSGDRHVLPNHLSPLSRDNEGSGSDLRRMEISRP